MCHGGDAIRVEPLYDATALGMWAYSRAAFRVATVGPERLELPPGTLLVATHRRESDVPVLAPPLWRRARLWQRRRRIAFVARHDLFLHGFFAGFPPGLPPRARKLLFPVAIGRALPHVHVHPVRSATAARLVEALAARADEPLADLLSAVELAAFEARARTWRLPTPARATDVVRGEYADLLWRRVERGDAAADERFWAARAAQAAADFRTLVELVRTGGRLLVFPEGSPSKDGTIGPLEPGLGALVRRARPAALAPIVLAYDPLVRGRPRVVVHLGEPVPPAEDGDTGVLTLLRRSMPLTAGQIAASGVDPAEALAEARAETRPVDPDLLNPQRTAERLAQARALAPSRPAEAAFLAREYESAREPAAATPRARSRPRGKSAGAQGG
jgi:1-acyl-sn-glycerol-3-phosphate acyltransferase